MNKIFFLILLFASQAFANEFYSRVYVAKTDTTITTVFDEINASAGEREEILRLNPELRRLEKIPAGTILNLTLYRGTNNKVSTNLRKLKVEDKRVEKNRLSVSPLLSFNNAKTGLNNDAEILTQSRSYGLGLGFEIPQSSFFGLNLYTQLMNVDFTNVKVKQQTGQDAKIDDNESRLNYDLGIKGIFNRTSHHNNFSVSLSRKVDHMYDFTKNKTFYTNSPSDYVAISKFAGWWMGAEFNQSLPFMNLPLEAGFGYSFIMDGNVTGEDSSSVRNLNGSRTNVSLMWKSTDKQTFGLGYQNFNYRSEFSSNGNSIGFFGNFKI